MNVIRGSRRGVPKGPISLLMSMAIVPLLFVIFMGSVFGLYSGGAMIFLWLVVIIYTFYAGVKNI